MELALTLDENSPEPLYRQLSRALRAAILSGRVAPADRLPSTRALAQSLGVSRTTVSQCYEQLLAEGYLRTVTGSGTFVSPALGVSGSRNRLHLQDRRPKGPDRPPPMPRLSSYGTRLERMGLFGGSGPPSAPARIDFLPGGPALDAFPLTLWGRITARCFRDGPRADLTYPFAPGGRSPLREAIAAYLARSRAVQCTPEQVLVVNGSQQALYLIARVLLDPGDALAMEDPGYAGAQQVFSAQSAEIHPVPVDDKGLCVDALPAAARVRLAYVTPSHQFPRGAVLSLPRRLALLDWAERNRVFIIEDDYDSEYRFDGRPMPALQGLDRAGCVLYVGTFSKVQFPALRLGYLVVPRALVSVFKAAKWLADHQTPILEQWAVTRFLEDGHLARHIRRMRGVYKRRRSVVVESIERHFGRRAAILGAPCGLHVTAHVETEMSDVEITRRAREAGVAIATSRDFALGTVRDGELIFGYGALSDDAIREGIRRLAAVVS